ncbi:MAG: hypothetical protein AB7T05_01555 [Fimbriimonadaceae bacterium]
MLWASLSNAVNVAIQKLPDTLSGTYNEIRFEVYVNLATETSLVEVWLETSSPSQPQDELDRESFPVPQEPPNNGTVPHASLFCKFDSTHWKHNEDVQFWLHATVWHQGQVTSIQPILIATRPVYNAAVVFQGLTNYSVALPQIIFPFEDLNHKVIKAKGGKWTRDQYYAELGPMTSHYVMTHGSHYGSGEGFLIPSQNPGQHITAAGVAANLPPPQPPVYFAYIAGCVVSKHNEIFALAYLSEAPSLTNRVVVSFKIKPTDAQAFAFFDGIMERSLAGMTVHKAADEEWIEGTAPFRLIDEYGELDSAVEFTGDLAARIKWLYDGTHNVHTDWKDNS